ncbi:MAG TPA: type II secretion system major pseudopilin GspG [Bryobacterales bacterium]|nr:type II secretion system major pseudopilin GspG [Bryobacterales bacterium]
MRQSKRINRRGATGITLIEMLVVITIIALFTAVAYQRLSPSVDKGRITAARTQIEAFEGALQTYHIDNGRFPTNDEGLQAIRSYLNKDVPNDPWGHPYVYKYPGDHGPEPDIICYGADGQAGGDGVNGDIVSWK